VTVASRRGVRLVQSRPFCTCTWILLPALLRCVCAGAAVKSRGLHLGDGTGRGRPGITRRSLSSSRRRRARATRMLLSDRSASSRLHEVRFARYALLLLRPTTPAPVGAMVGGFGCTAAPAVRRQPRRPRDATRADLRHYAPTHTAHGRRTCAGGVMGSATTTTRR
jgi:hypothetical protein